MLFVEYIFYHSNTKEVECSKYYWNNNCPEDNLINIILSCNTAIDEIRENGYIKYPKKCDCYNHKNHIREFVLFHCFVIIKVNDY